MKKRFFLVYVGFLLVTIACVCTATGSGTEPTFTPSELEETIGTVRRERNQVEHRHTGGSFQLLIGTNPLFNGDDLQVTQGGEGLLDFGDSLRLRLFNDSELGEIKAESATDIPLNARMTLERGGFTGRLTGEGSQADFDTPSGALITVYGTEFFVIYVEDSGLTAAGNFNGQMDVTAEGTTVQVPAGHFVIVPEGGPPEPPQSPIPFSLDGFEQLSREDSPLAALPLLISFSTPESTPTPSDTPTPTPTQEPTDTPTDTLTPTPTPFFNTGYIVVKRGERGNITLLEIHPDGEMTPLVSGVDNADVLDYTATDGGKYAIRVVVDDEHTLWIVGIDGVAIASGLNPGWTSITDGDWSPDGQRLIVEGEPEDTAYFSRYFFFDENGKFLDSP